MAEVAGGVRRRPGTGPSRLRLRIPLSYRPGFAALIDQHGLLPGAGGLVGAVDAAGPAAGAFLALDQFLEGAFDAALAGLGLLGVPDLADELVAAERRQACPQGE